MNRSRPALLVLSAILAVPTGAFSLVVLGAPTAAGPDPADFVHGHAADDRHLPAVRCAICHSNSDRASALRDDDDRPIAPYDLWQSSMMANSGRDPFWRAAVSAEILATPSKKGLIEEKCTRCHTPTIRPVAESPDGEVLAALAGHGESARLGRDGVTCTICHRIADRKLGTAASFTGRFELSDEPLIFGPHSAPMGMPMNRFTGFTPTFGAQITRSALCATCHTLTTETVDPSGEPTGHRHHEQTPYLEWRNSVYNDERTVTDSDARSCQDCHLPTTDVDGDEIETRIARNPGGRDFGFTRRRSPFGRHLLVGGNTLIPRMLRDEPSLGAQASTEAFDRTIAAARHQLQHDTARVTIGAIARDGDAVTIPVTIENLGGHKLPTGYPSRRVWLRVEVRDRTGTTRFLSGATDERGRLVGPDGEPLASESAGGPTLPHYEMIERPECVQIYETVMADPDGKPTTTLLRAAGHLKDNRLLPRGWSADGPHARETAPVGVGDDADFRDGRDTVRYRLDLPASGAPYRVEASALYLVLSPRHAAELFAFETPEVRTFEVLYRKTPDRGVRLATASAGF